MAFNDTEYRRRRRSEDPAYAATRREASRNWKKRRVDAVLVLIQAGKDRPCVDCGKQLPYYCMEYDHVHGRKEFSIAKAARNGVTIEQLRAEIAKCEVRCVICHRTRHHEGELST